MLILLITFSFMTDLNKANLITDRSRNSILSLVAEPNKNGRKNSGITDDERKKIMTTEVINDNNIVTPLLGKAGDKIYNKEEQIDRVDVREKNKDEINEIQKNKKIEINGLADTSQIKKNLADKIEINKSNNRSINKKPVTAQTANIKQSERTKGLPNDLFSIKKNDLLSEIINSENRCLLCNRLSETKRREHEEDIFKSKGISIPSAPSNSIKTKFDNKRTLN